MAVIKVHLRPKSNVVQSQWEYPTPICQYTSENLRFKMCSEHVKIIILTTLIPSAIPYWCHFIWVNDSDLPWNSFGHQLRVPLNSAWKHFNYQLAYQGGKIWNHTQNSSDSPIRLPSFLFLFHLKGLHSSSIWCMFTQTGRKDIKHI